MALIKKALTQALGRGLQPSPRDVRRVLELDYNYIAELFLRKTFNAHDPAYGHWVTPEEWVRLNPYGHPRGQGHFHPSSGLTWDSTGCVRLTILDLLCASRSPTRVDPKLIRILENGTNRHVGLHVMFLGMAKLQWMGIQKYEFEKRVVHPFYPIEGSLDGDLTIESVELILDYKTMSPLEWAKLRKPSLKHQAQLLTYEVLSKVQNGFLLYENKGTQEWAGPPSSFAVTLDPTVREKLRKDIETFVVEVLDMANSHVLPEFDEAVCRGSIKFCAYRDTCGACRENGDDPDYVAQVDHRPDQTRKKHLRVLQTGKRPCL